MIIGSGTVPVPVPYRQPTLFPNPHSASIPGLEKADLDL